MKRLSLAVLMLTAGCTTSSTKITGTLRPAVSPGTVKVYRALPANSQTIGLVSATSYAGMTWQGARDHALAQLKMDAGQLGANGIVLTNGADAPLSGVTVAGDAIFVAR